MIQTHLLSLSFDYFTAGNEILTVAPEVRLIRHDYQSPRSKSPKKSWECSGHPGMSRVFPRLLGTFGPGTLVVMSGI